MISQGLNSKRSLSQPITLPHLAQFSSMALLPRLVQLVVLSTRSFLPCFLSLGLNLHVLPKKQVQQYQLLQLLGLVLLTTASWISSPQNKYYTCLSTEQDFYSASPKGTNNPARTTLDCPGRATFPQQATRLQYSFFSNDQIQHKPSPSRVGSTVYSRQTRSNSKCKMTTSSIGNTTHYIYIKCSS